MFRISLMFYICIRQNETNYKIYIMKTFTLAQYANETLILIEELKADLLKYMGCKSMKVLKKDSKFQAMVAEIKDYQAMRIDLISGAINEAKLQKLLTLLN